MKRTPTILTFALGMLTVFSHSAYSQNVKRVLWTEEEQCRLSGFSDVEISSLVRKCDSWVSNDAFIQVVQIDDMVVTVIIGDDDDYLLVDTYVTNKSDGRVLLDPYQSTLFTWKDGNLSKPPERFQPIAPDDIAKKLRRNARWWNVLDGLLTGFAESLNKTTITTETSGNISASGSSRANATAITDYGRVTAYGNSSFSATGHYTGTTTTTISTPDIVGRLMLEARSFERVSNAKNEGEYYRLRGMKANTLLPKDTKSGLIYFKRKKAPTAVFTIRVGDILFDFPSPKPTASGVGARSGNVAQIPTPDADFLTGRQSRNSAPITPPNLAANTGGNVSSRSPQVASTSSTTPQNPTPVVIPSPVAAPAPDNRKNTAGIELVWIPAGSFQMGSADGEKYEKPVRRVVISEGFWMGKYEVTQVQWFAEMGLNPSDFEKCGGACPVENVSWEDAQRFVARLNAKNDGFVYSLPTEAQWEYAARAGTTGKWAGDVKEMAWYSDNSNGRTQPVGTKRANAFGLYDMHGNVWEWCADWYGDYPKTPETDPRGPAKGKYKILRGGSWKDGSGDARSAYRGGLSPNTKYKDIGFRVVARTK